jgi:hypothetical protein
MGILSPNQCLEILCVRLRYRAQQVNTDEETVAVCCESRTEHTDTLGSAYLTGDKSRLRYRTQPVNAVWGNSRCLL